MSHAEVHQVGDHLRVRLRLVVAAHDAEGCPRPPVFQDHRGHQRVQRPLVRPDLIGMSGREDEPRPAVVQRDARVAGDEARAEGGEQRLDEGHHVAVSIGDRQIDSVAPVLPGELARGAGVGQQSGLEAYQHGG